MSEAGLSFLNRAINLCVKMTIARMEKAAIQLITILAMVLPDSPWLELELRSELEWEMGLGLRLEFGLKLGRALGSVLRSGLGLKLESDAPVVACDAKEAAVVVVVGCVVTGGGLIPVIRPDLLI